MKRMLLHFYVLNAQNEAVPVTDSAVWSEWCRTHDCVVARTVLPSGTVVQTVFAALDHRRADEKPALWYTSVFQDGVALTDTRTYASHADALHGHEEAVADAEDEACGRSR